MKTCTKCGIEKELTEFHKRKSAKDGLSFECKACNYERCKAYRESNKAELEIKKQIYYLNNKNIINKRRQCQRVKNKNKIRKQQRNSYLKNKEHYIKKATEWKNENIERRRENVNNWMKNKRRTDVEFKINSSIRQRMRYALYNSGRKKTKPFNEYTGIQDSEYIEYFKTTQPEEFNLYLQEGAYHIDHIIPCSLYDFTDEEEIRKCWHPHNLRIIPAKENIIKSNKLCLQLVDKYNIRHLLPKEVI